MSYVENKQQIAPSPHHPRPTHFNQTEHLGHWIAGDGASDSSTMEPTAPRRKTNRRIGGHLVPVDCEDLDLPREAYSTFYRHHDAVERPVATANPQHLHKNFHFFTLNHHRAVEMHPRTTVVEQPQLHRPTNTTPGPVAAPDLNHRIFPTPHFLSQLAYGNALFDILSSRPHLLVNPFSRPLRPAASSTPFSAINTAEATARSTTLSGDDLHDSPTPPTSPRFIPPGGDSPYKSWDELPPNAKLTTSAAARKARKGRYWRDPDTVDHTIADSIEKHMDELTGEIYDAMVDVSVANDKPNAVCMTVLTRPVRDAPLFPAKKIVAMAYWVVVRPAS